MTRTPTALVLEHLTRDPGLLRDARRRLTLADDALEMRERIAAAIGRTPARGCGVARNERVIRSHAHLGPLRRALVQWATLAAPAEIGGFQPLLAWALGHVDWPTVVRSIAVQAGNLTPRPPSVPPVWEGGASMHIPWRSSHAAALTTLPSPFPRRGTEGGRGVRFFRPHAVESWEK